MIEEFERHLRGTNLSENTVTSYLFAVRQFGDGMMPSPNAI